MMGKSMALDNVLDNVIDLPGVSEVRGLSPRVHDVDVVEAVRARDLRCIGDIYDQHHRKLRNLALRLVNDDEVADDLVHDVFVALPKAIKNFKGQSSLSTFLCGMLINHARHHIRSAVRRRSAMARLALEYSGQNLPGDAAYEQHQLSHLAGRALDSLHPDLRIAFVLCEVEEMLSYEAALVMKVKPATVRSRLFRAKHKLQQFFKREGWR